MTVCIAALCDGGQSVVVAADRMVTSGLGIEFEHESPKIEQLSQRCFAATAGNALAYTELFDRVHLGIDELRQPIVESVAEMIKAAYQEVRQTRVTETILQPRGISSLGNYHEIVACLPPPIVQQIEFDLASYDYMLDILLIGRSYNKARIYHVRDPGTSACYDAIHFHVIGSGFTLGYGSLINNGFHSGLDLPMSVDDTAGREGSGEKRSRSWRGHRLGDCHARI